MQLLVCNAQPHDVLAFPTRTAPETLLTVLMLGGFLLVVEDLSGWASLSSQKDFGNSSVDPRRGADSI